MPPVRVKVYGLFALTKRAYLIIQVVGAIVFLALAAGAFFLPHPQAPEGSDLPPWLSVCALILDNLPWIVLIVLALEGIETFFVLRRFVRQEVLQRATAPETPSQT